MNHLTCRLTQALFLAACSTLAACAVTPRFGAQAPTEVPHEESPPAILNPESSWPESLEGSTLWNTAPGVAVIGEEGFRGVHIAGIATVSRGDLEGIGLSGLVIASDENIAGINVAGVALASAGGVRNLSVAGLVICDPDCSPWAFMPRGPRSEDAAVANNRGIMVAGLRADASYIEGLAVAGLINRSHDFDGVGISAHNSVSGMQRGLQVGVFNYANDLCGMQVGLLNYVPSNPWYLRWMPLVNVRF